MDTLDLERFLQDISDQIFLEFLHSCVNSICGKESAHSYENYKSCSNWSKDEFVTLNKSFRSLFWTLINVADPKEKILELHPNIASNHLQCILDCLNVRKVDLQTVLIQKSYSISGSVVHDFDWKLKWVMGTSALSSLREPLLQLDFNVCDSEDGTDNCSVKLELNSNEVKQLITSLEKAEECLKNC